MNPIPIGDISYEIRTWPLDKGWDKIERQVDIRVRWPVHLDMTTKQIHFVVEVVRPSVAELGGYGIYY